MSDIFSEKIGQEGIIGQATNVTLRRLISGKLLIKIRVTLDSIGFSDPIDSDPIFSLGG
jgi:hypothetical protein